MSTSATAVRVRAIGMISWLVASTGRHVQELACLPLGLREPAFKFRLAPRGLPAHGPHVQSQDEPCPSRSRLPEQFRGSPFDMLPDRAEVLGAHTDRSKPGSASVSGDACRIESVNLTGELVIAHSLQLGPPEPPVSYLSTA